MENNEIKLSNGMSIDAEAIHFNLRRLINQVYKLLPMREEKKNWEKPLETLIEEIAGMRRLIVGQDNLFFLILCKLEGLFNLVEQTQMTLYRRVIFECLGLLNSLDKNVYG